MATFSASAPLNRDTLDLPEFQKPSNATLCVQKYVTEQLSFARQYARDGASIVLDELKKSAAIPTGPPESTSRQAHSPHPTMGPADRALLFSSPILQPRVPEASHNVPNPSDSPILPRNSYDTALVQHFGIEVSARRQPQHDVAKAAQMTTEQTYLDEHEARLAQRRERRRAKRAILDPPARILSPLPKPKALPEDSKQPQTSDTRISSKRKTTNKDTNQSRKNVHRVTAEDGDDCPPLGDMDDMSDKENSLSDDSPRKPKKKKTKLSPGLALMQNFQANNISKSRITLKAPQKVGVFSKGVASAKTNVPRANRSDSERKKRKLHPTFDEKAFLNHTRPARESPTPPERLDAPSDSISESSSRDCDAESIPPEHQRSSTKEQPKRTSTVIKLDTGKTSRFFQATRTVASPSNDVPREPPDAAKHPDRHSSPPWEIDWEAEGVQPPAEVEIEALSTRLPSGDMASGSTPKAVDDEPLSTCEDGYVVGTGAIPEPQDDSPLVVYRHGQINQVEGPSGSIWSRAEYEGGALGPGQGTPPNALEGIASARGYSNEIFDSEPQAEIQPATAQGENDLRLEYDFETPWDLEVEQSFDGAPFIAYVQNTDSQTGYQLAPAAYPDGEESFYRAYADQCDTDALYSNEVDTALEQDCILSQQPSTSRGHRSSRRTQRQGHSGPFSEDYTEAGHWAQPAVEEDYDMDIADVHLSGYDRPVVFCEAPGFVDSAPSDYAGHSEYGNYDYVPDAGDAVKDSYVVWECAESQSLDDDFAVVRQGHFEEYGIDEVNSESFGVPAMGWDDEGRYNSPALDCPSTESRYPLSYDRVSLDGTPHVAAQHLEIPRRHRGVSSHLNSSRRVGVTASDYSDMHECIAVSPVPPSPSLAPSPNIEDFTNTQFQQGRALLLGLESAEPPFEPPRRRVDRQTTFGGCQASGDDIATSVARELEKNGYWLTGAARRYT